MDIGEQSEYAKSWIEFRFIGPIENIERARQHVEQRLDLLQVTTTEIFLSQNIRRKDYPIYLQFNIK